jgi:hypothetical protein
MSGVHDILNRRSAELIAALTPLWTEHARLESELERTRRLIILDRRRP